MPGEVPYESGAQPASATTVGSLHEHAVQAEEHLEQLATGLGQAGAEPNVVKTVTQMAGVARKLVLALGKGQEQTGDEEPPPDEPQAPLPPSRPRTIQGATEELQATARARAGA